MKKLFAILSFFLIAGCIYAQNQNQIYKEISPNTFRWVSVNITEYDVSANKIYYKTPHGKEEWYDYDEKGRLIHTKNSS